MDQKDGRNRMPVAKSKLQRAIIRQKKKSNNGSTAYDFNLHLALITALRTLNVLENKNRHPARWLNAD